MSENPLAKLLQIEQQVRQSESLKELLFVMVNDTRGLVDYQQAGFFSGSEFENLKLAALSDMPLLDRSTPFAAFLEKAMRQEDAQPNPDTIHDFKYEAKSAIFDNTAEYTPPYWLWVPMQIPSRPNERMGVLWLAKSTQWTEKEISLLQHLSSSYAHALQIFNKQSFKQKLKKTWQKKLVWGLVGASLAASMFIPVRLSVLAPAEVAAKQPTIVTAPLNGAIKEIKVSPGQLIKESDLLATMEDVQLRGDYEVSLREHSKALAELKTAQQAGFHDYEAKSRIAELVKIVELKNSQKEYAKSLLEKRNLKSYSAGVAIINDPQEWQGKPVTVGEKIMMIANPEKVQLRIMVPTKDAVSLHKGAEVKFFMDTDPVNPLSAKIRYAVYEPELTEDQIMAYRVVADFSSEEGFSPPRIGLHGTAKIYAEEVSLFFYLFRRPITSLRQWIGW